MNSEVLTSYVFQPDVDLHYVQEHMVEWVALANNRGQPSALTFAGPTFSLPLNMGARLNLSLKNLARVIDKYSGLRSFAQQLVGAAGDRLQSIRASAVNLLMRHGNQASLLVFSDSSLNFGKSTHREP